MEVEARKHNPVVTPPIDAWCDACGSREQCVAFQVADLYPEEMCVCRPCLMQIVHVAWDGKVILVETEVK